MNLKSASQLKRRALLLIDSHATFIESSARDILDNPLHDFGPSVNDLSNLADSLRPTVVEAKAIVQDANFTALPDDVQADVTAIATETDVAVSELADLTAPDAVWSQMDLQRKHAAVSQFRHGVAVGRDIHARLQLNKTGQPKRGTEPAGGGKTPPGQSK
jgi:hypothetical protein